MATLRQLNAELQARNQELDAFAQTVAHDLKNPLSRVATAGQLLRQYGPDLTPQENDVLIENITNSSQRMQTIINSLLLLASARQAEVELAPLNMAGIIEQACERLAAEIRDSQATIVRPETWPAAVGHEPWLVEVWYNYLSNALKYGGRPLDTPPVAPWIELGADSLPDGYVRYWVKDNGQGISEEDQKRLFMPFSPDYRRGLAPLATIPGRT